MYIPKYPWLKPVFKLTTYPLSYCPNRQEIQANLLARDRKFAALRGFHVNRCDGEKYTSVQQDPDEHPRVANDPRPVSHHFFSLSDFGARLRSELFADFWKSYHRRICVLPTARNAPYQPSSTRRNQHIRPKQYGDKPREPKSPRPCKRGEKGRSAINDRLGMHIGSAPCERL